MRLQCRITIEEGPNPDRPYNLLGFSFYGVDAIEEKSRGVNIFLQDDMAPCERAAHVDNTLLEGAVVTEWGHLLLEVAFGEPPRTADLRNLRKELIYQGILGSGT